MKLKFETDVNDLIAYRSYIYDTSEAVQSKIKKYRMFYIFYIIVMSTLYYFNNSVFTLLILIVCVVLAVKFIFFNKKLYLRRAKNNLLMYKPDLSESNFTEIELGEDYILTSDNNAETKIYIKNIKQVTDWNEYTFIILDELQAVSIPHKKIFEGNLDRFKDSLSNKLQSINKETL